MEKETATCSSILAGEISRTEEPGGLLFKGWGGKESGMTEHVHTHDLIVASKTWGRCVCGISGGDSALLPLSTAFVPRPGG